MRKTKKQRKAEENKRSAAIGLPFMLCMLFLLTGCSAGNAPKLANEISFSMDEINEISISYDEEEITFLESENEELIVKEYMTKDKSRYYAKVKQRGGSIQISEGAKPLFQSGFSRYIEVYLPASYREALTITSTNGKVDLSGMSLELTELRIDCTSGSVFLHEASAESIYLSSASGLLKIGTIQGTHIRLETTSGTLSCEEVEGEVFYTSTSGDCEIKSAVGSGEYKAENAGRLDVSYAEVEGNLFLFNKNEDIRLTLPKKLEFEFLAKTKNGTITTSFQKDLTSDETSMKGSVGENPVVTVEVETKNGKIEVVQ